MLNSRLLMKQQNEFYENIQNVTASYLFYDENGYDYELAEEQICTATLLKQKSMVKTLMILLCK